MRVVFLDFDGVLHPAGGGPGRVLPFEWVPHLARTLAPFIDVRVVVHSSWREQFSQDYLRDFLEPLGDAFVGVVPPGPKGLAIQQFLDEHPQVSDAVILDDQAEELLDVIGAQLLICDPSVGISCPQLQARLDAWLRQPASSCSVQASRADAPPASS